MLEFVLEFMLEFVNNPQYPKVLRDVVYIVLVLREQLGHDWLNWHATTQYGANETIGSRSLRRPMTMLNVRDRVWDRGWDRGWDRLGDRMRDRLGDRLGDRVRDRVRNRVGGRG